MTVFTTVTVNPSLDRTLHVGALRRGDVHRAHRVSVEPSGKGVNVALALHAVGLDTVAVLPVGGPSGTRLVTMLDALGLRHVDVPVASEVRTNVSLVEADGTTTKINELGSALTDEETAALLAAALQVGTAGEWVAWCGSLPTGVSDHTLADAVASCRAAGRRVAVDTSGSTLAIVLGRSRVGLPHLVKPNAHELAELTGRTLRTTGDVADAAVRLVHHGVGTVLVSLGADGALLADEHGVFCGRAPVDRVVNTVGAGDAFLAGYLAADGAAADRRLAEALRFGAVAVRAPGTLSEPADRATIERRQPVQVGPVDRDRLLQSPVI